MSICISVSRHRSCGGVSFLLFTMKSTIRFSVILSLCRLGNHVLLFPGSIAMMLGFQASYFQTFLWFFFFFSFFSFDDRSTSISGNAFDAKRKKGEWPWRNLNRLIHASPKVLKWSTTPPSPDLTGSQTITSFLGSHWNCFQLHFDLVGLKFFELIQAISLVHKILRY